LPVWFLVLGAFYWLNTRRSPHQRKLIEDFKKKVIVQTAAAAIYQAKQSSK
jgi:hypothetical protein